MKVPKDIYFFFMENLPILTVENSVCFVCFRIVINLTKSNLFISCHDICCTITQYKVKHYSLKDQDRSTWSLWTPNNYTIIYRVATWNIFVACL